MSDGYRNGMCMFCLTHSLSVTLLIPLLSIKELSVQEEDGSLSQVLPVTGTYHIRAINMDKKSEKSEATILLVCKKLPS